MKPIGYYSISYDAMIMIYSIIYDIDTYVVYTYKTTIKESRKIRAKIRYDKNGNAYFREKNPVLLAWCMKYQKTIKEKNTMKNNNKAHRQLLGCHKKNWRKYMFFAPCVKIIKAKRLLLKKKA